jgi:SAM-dependent methyltransferase
MTDRARNSGYDNTGLVETGQAIDSINGQFYTRFPYPWPPTIIRRIADEHFESDMLSQSLGEWNTSALPDRPRIWVAGCGTNQAALTALKFPAAHVVGSDVSAGSLAAEARLAEALGVENLELRNESINDVSYDSQFDYVISTGVIHHNADPGAPLAKISCAMRPDAVLELMVYNRYHCIEAAAVQSAIKILASANAESGFDAELELATMLLSKNDDLKSRITQYFDIDPSEAALADAVIQPVTHTFTVLELEQLAASCGLDLIQPCINQFDVTRNCFDWYMPMPDEGLRASYENLSDTLRWHVTNLVQLEQSPMLWFYLRRSASARPKRTEREIADQFLDQVFEIAQTSSQMFRRTAEGTYEPFRQPVGYPAAHPEDRSREIAGMVAKHGRARMRDVLAEKGVPTDFATLNRLRICLTTNSFPYLRSAGGHS